MLKQVKNTLCYNQRIKECFCGFKMIYDCFTFYNGFELLEARLNILNDIVDRFVIVEATKTQSNQDKILFFKENQKRFKAFENKIIHIIVDKYPEIENSWTIENYQRNCISQALINCKDDDIIIISDFDEIPNPQSILEYKDSPGIKAFQQHVFYYYLNNLSNEYWDQAKMLSYKDFKNILDDYNIYRLNLSAKLNQGTTATKIRLYKGEKLTVINNGGWHFSYMMSPEAIVNKIKIFAHQEFNNKNYNDIQTIKEKINRGEDLFNRPELKYCKVKITEEEFPPYIVANQDKFKEFILSNAKYMIKDLQ